MNFQFLFEFSVEDHFLRGFSPLRFPFIPGNGEIWPPNSDFRTKNDENRNFQIRHAQVVKMVPNYVRYDFWGRGGHTSAQILATATVFSYGKLRFLPKIAHFFVFFGFLSLSDGFTVVQNFKIQFGTWKKHLALVFGSYLGIWTWFDLVKPVPQIWRNLAPR